MERSSKTTLFKYTPAHLAFLKERVPFFPWIENLLLVSKEIYARISHCILTYGVPFQQLPNDLQDAILLNAQLKQQINQRQGAVNGTC